MNIETHRLTLRPLTHKDSEAIFHTLNYEGSVNSIYLFEWPLTMEQAERWCARAEKGFESGKEHIFLVSTTSDKKPIGCIGIHYSAGTETQAEIGYWLDEKQHGNGYAAEMLQALIAHAFAQGTIKELYATTAMDNEASQSLLQRNGFTQDEIVEIEKAPGETRQSRKFVLHRS